MDVKEEKCLVSDSGHNLAYGCVILDGRAELARPHKKSTGGRLARWVAKGEAPVRTFTHWKVTEDERHPMKNKSF